MTQNEQDIQQGLKLLREARALFIIAGAVKTVAKVRSAIKSAEGAARHAQNEPYRAARKAGA